MRRFLTAICLGLIVSPATLAGSDDVQSDLEKWIETDPPEPHSGRWVVAANDYKHEWVVTLREDRPQVRLRDRNDEPPAPLPFDTEPAMSIKRRLRFQSADGWIVSYNAGEFGGAIWWYSPDGRKRYKIGDAHVVRLISTKEGLLAIEGLAHLSSSEGRILRLSQGPEGRWQSEDFVDLKHAPAAVAKAADGSLIIATSDRLLRVVPATKEVEVILDNVFWRSLYPNSMVITPKGVIYVGMRHGVAKVETEKNGARRLRWLLPNKAFDEMRKDQGRK